MAANVLRKDALKEEVLLYSPQPGPQTAAMCCPIPDLLFGGARGGGKTYYLLGDFFAHQQNYGKGAKGIILRRTYAELDEVQAQAMEIFTPAGAMFKGGKATWVFPNGAQLKLRYLRRDEDASHYQGHQYTWIGIDEAGNFAKPDPIDKLRATLRSKSGVPTFMRLTANPGGPGHGWLKQRYVDPAPPMTPHKCPTSGAWRVFIPSKLQDNLILLANDPTYAERIRGSGPAWLVQAWLHGDWNAAPDGGVFKTEWFKHYDDLPNPPDAYMLVHSWDTAYKAKQHSDPSVLTVWVIGTKGYYLKEVWREKVEYPTLKQRMLQFAERDKPNVVLIEDKASGQSLIQELMAETSIPVKAIEPEGDKLTRALAVTPLIESGRVFLPHAASWLLDYELELSIFPTTGAHDDQVDSTTQFLAWARKHASRKIEIIGGGIKRTSYTQQEQSTLSMISRRLDTKGY